MMTSSKGPAASLPVAADQVECCMCGDSGLSSELFRCKICQFRSQHRYCSNIYPRAESYRVCNWCLNEKEDAVEKGHNSFNSSSSNKNSTSTSEQDDAAVIIKTNKKSTNPIGAAAGGNNLHNNNVKTSSEKGTTLKMNASNRSIKKQKSPSPEISPLSAARKRITTATGAGGGGVKKEINLRRTKSDIPKSVIYKHVFRNKVRRYKLLDDVSS